MNLRHSITVAGRVAGVLGILASLLLLLGARPAGAEGYEVPGAAAYRNAPGWATVVWAHSGVGVYWYNIERQDRQDVVRREYAPSGTYTDTGLQGSTQYNYRVCAVYDYNQVCSDWTSAPAWSAPPPSGGSTPPPAGGTTPPPAPQPANVQLTATAQHPTSIRLTFSVQGGSEASTDRFVVFRHNPVDKGRSSIIHELKRPDLKGFSGSFTDTDVRANTEYFYSVCFQVVPSNTFTLCSPRPLASATVAVPLPPQPTNLRVKERTLEYLELAFTTNITDPSSTTEYDLYRNGARIKTQIGFPIVENHFFDEALLGTVLYKVCAVDDRGTADEVQSCTAELRVVPLPVGTALNDPGKLPAALQPVRITPR